MSQNIYDLLLGAAVFASGAAALPAPLHSLVSSCTRIYKHARQGLA